MPATTPNFLEFLMVLCKICKNCDSDGLKKFVTYSSLYASDADFTKLVYTAMRIMVNKKCLNTSCEDWLITSLYKIYKSI